MKKIYDDLYDVIIAGGGVSGTMAAIAAARCGAKTLLLEQAGYLGGTLTSCGVGPMMTFFAGKEQVIKGLMQELVDRMIAAGYSCGHIQDTTRYVTYITPFDAEGMKLILDNMTAEAGSNVLLHTAVGKVISSNGRIDGLVVCNKDGLHTIKGKLYIDATGDGDIMYWAGAETVKGRPEDSAGQPLTLKMRLCHVDTGQLKQYIQSNPADFPRLKHNMDLVTSPIPLALAGMESEFHKAKAAGKLHIPREDVLMFETCHAGEFIVNTTRILNCDATDAASLTAAEAEGRRQCAELYHFLKTCIPGFEHALLEYTGPSVGIRSSRQLVGKYTLTAQDVLTAKKFSSVIAHSGYPIDIHSPDGEGTHTYYIGEDGGRAYYDIPYEIMLPQSIPNLMVTGRCVSASFEAQASIRLTPSVGAMGQAAGTAAALAAKADCSPDNINIETLQQKLRENGAYIDRIP